MSKNTASAVNAEITDALLDGLVEEGQEKFEYLAEKDPSPKHEFYSAMITALTGVEVTPKQYQAMITTHRYIQASDLNRAREDYRPRTVESVVKASETLLERASEMLTEGDFVISKSSTHIPDEVAQAVNSQLEVAAASRRAKAAELAAQMEAAQKAASEAVEEATEVAEEAPGEDIFASGGDVAEESVSEAIFAAGGDAEQEELSPKALLIQQLIELELDADQSLDVEKRERSLNRKSVAKLQEAFEALELAQC